MVRLVVLVLLGSIITSCAALAGISDDPADPSTPTPLPSESPDARGGQQVDGAPVPMVDAATPDAAPPPIAAIQVRCNNAVVAKWSTNCAKRWEYDFAPCAGPTRKVILENIGAYPVAYIARRSWALTTYVPDKPTDGQNGETTGIIAAGANADISGAFPTGGGGIFAIIGSVTPFDLGAPTKYEGAVAYAKPTLGTFDTKGELQVAELTATPFMGVRCYNNPVVFTKK